MRRDSPAPQRGSVTPLSGGTAGGGASGYPLYYWNSPVELVEVRGADRIFHVFDRQYVPPLTRKLPVVVGDREFSV